MKFPLYTDLSLARDIPEHRLRRGDMVRPVEFHVAPSGEEGYSVEVLGAKGQTLTVVAVAATALEELHEGEVLSVRVLAL